ncbi:protein-tyrosine phosphatase-like protein [Lobosporangium transversale]|uniref:protein-tyrosine-phosphatase n=1 Tax=Lobosporangium transversale TaxID=64571 RepID=A0A1Y2GF46_9FUNG|nr:protein-tyrosine phosphatase-like protein [Lobosporangium transversale]ORZ09076.1 protein-tyrosine phosphatase-like protein [Lobosporangium transversale]|eukprot:XP_021878703.1 protein-tyrosine phosphatase-like protein [Lobosporangium transversale]
MYRTVSSDGSLTSSTATALNPTTAARLQRLPTPPRSPGLAPLGKQLTLIEPPMTKGIRFLILDCPTDSTLPFYLAELKRNNVTDVVRCCEPTYSTATLQAENISVHDWPFRDGAVPPTPIIKNWLQLVDSRIVRQEEMTQVPTIAVHCVAGLGRAPILVAIAMIELGMANLDTVEFIRRRRRGCFNSLQIQYIDGYKRGKILKHALGSGSGQLSGSSPLAHGASGSGSSGGVGGVAGSVKNGLNKMFRLKA